MNLRPLGPHPPTKGDVPRHSELVKLNEVGDGAEPLEELDGCLEVLGVQLDKGSGGEYHPRAQHHPPLLQAV